MHVHGVTIYIVFSVIVRDQQSQVKMTVIWQKSSKHVDPGLNNSDWNFIIVIMGLHCQTSFPWVGWSLAWTDVWTVADCCAVLSKPTDIKLVFGSDLASPPVCGTPAEVPAVGTMPCFSWFASPAAWLTGRMAPAGKFLSTLVRYMASWPISAAIWNTDEKRYTVRGQGEGTMWSSRGSLGSLSRLFEQADRQIQSWMCYLEFLWAQTAKGRTLVKNDRQCKINIIINKKYKPDCDNDSIWVYILHCIFTLDCWSMYTIWGFCRRKSESLSICRIYCPLNVAILMLNMIYF